MIFLFISLSLLKRSVLSSSLSLFYYVVVTGKIVLLDVMLRFDWIEAHKARVPKVSDMVHYHLLGDFQDFSQKNPGILKKFS